MRHLVVALLLTLTACGGPPIVDRCPQCPDPVADSGPLPADPYAGFSPQLPDPSPPDMGTIGLPSVPSRYPIPPDYAAPGRCVDTAFGYSAC